MQDKVKKHIDPNEAFEEFINSKKLSSMKVEYNHCMIIGKDVSTPMGHILINKCYFVVI